MAYRDKKDQAAASKRHYEANKKKIKKRSFLRNKSQRRKQKNILMQLKVYLNVWIAEKVIH